MSAFEAINLRKLLEGVVGNSPFGIVTLSSGHEVGILNRVAKELLGFRDDSLEDLVDSPVEFLFARLPEVTEYVSTQETFKAIEAKDIPKLELGDRTVDVRIRPLFNGVLILLDDVTKTTELANRLKHAASIDSLTQLLNRAEFETLGKRAIDNAVQQKESGAILFIDLDKFKLVNDQGGHEAGDKLLIGIAGLFRDVVRHRDLLARIGGDEFTVLLEHCSIAKATSIAQKLCEQINHYRLVHKGKGFSVGASVGVASFGKDGDSFASVLSAADNASAIAKRIGGKRVHVADESYSEYKQYLTEVSWLPRLQAGLSENQFVLYQQSICSSGPTNDTINEVLIRYIDPNRGAVLPSEFIPPSERYGLIDQIDRWVIHETFAKAKKGQTYSINLSGVTICDLQTVDFIKQEFSRSSASPENIIFEITETAAINNFATARQFIEQINQLGCRFALDDFGAGLSSFAYLRQLPVDFLKIDKSLIDDVCSDERAFAIVESIASMAKAMQICTIAEGVEEGPVANRLVEAGIDYLQGFLFDRPRQFDEAVVH